MFHISNAAMTQVSWHKPRVDVASASEALENLKRIEKEMEACSKDAAVHCIIDELNRYA